MSKDEQHAAQDPRYWLALSRVPSLGARTLNRMLAALPSAASIFDQSTARLQEFGVKPGAIDYIQAPAWATIERDLHWLEQPGNYLVTLLSEHYPVLLRQIHDPPTVLYVRGNPAVLDTIQLGIVGSRRPTPSGRRLAGEFARQLAGLGLTISSGLATGIDSCGHRGAIDTDGRTIAVLGNGLSTVYPASNRRLAEAILERGAIVSELPLDYRPLPRHFPRRNRIISGMSTGVLVVEAALRSGSLITARCAMEQGRDVFAIPGSIHNPMTRGCHALLREGAKLVEGIEDIIEEIGPLAALAGRTEIETGSSMELTNGLDADAKVLLDNIGYEPSNVDFLVEATGLTVNVISRALLDLELQGLIESLPGGCCIRK